MKKIYTTLQFILVFLVHSKVAIAQGQLSSDFGFRCTLQKTVSWNPGTFVMSANGKYKLLWDSDGYLKAYQMTPLGPLEVTRYGKPGNAGSLLKVSINTGSYAKYYLGAYYLGSDYPADESRLTISNEGHVVFIKILNGGIQGVLYSFTGETDPYNVRNMAKITNGDIVVNPMFNDETHATYFGNSIIFPGTKVVQERKPVNFRAKDYIDLKPGFESYVTAAGAVKLEAGIAQVAGAFAGKQEDIKTDLSGPISVVPNPNNGVFSVNLEDHKEFLKEVILYDLAGKKVFNESGSSSTFNIRELPSGIYVYQILTSKTRYSGKFIKQ